MSNKTQLQENNTKLNTILSNALGLPTQESMKNGKYVWKKSKRGIDSVEVKGSYTKGMANYGMLLSTGKALFDNNKKYIGKPNSDNFPAGETGFYILAPSTDNKGQIIDGETIYHITGFTVGNVNLPDVEMYNDYKINYTETFISYVVSDNESEYPDKAVHSDGFYYEKITECLNGINVTKISSGNFTPTSDTPANKINIKHTLGVKPKVIAFWSNEYSGSNYAIMWGFTNAFVNHWTNEINHYGVLAYSYSSTSPNLYGITVDGSTDNTINFKEPDNSYYFKAGFQYNFITMA